VTLGYKGRLLVTATCERDWSHTAGAEQSAADTLHEWWASLLEQIQRKQPAKLFDRVQATIQSCRSSNDGLREIAEMTCGFRLPPGTPPESLEAIILAMTPAPIEIRFAGHTPAHVADRSNPVARALSSAIRASGGSPRP